MIDLDIVGKPFAFAVELPPGCPTSGGLQAVADDMAAHINSFADATTFRHA